MARQFNLIPPICEQAEYHMFQREKVEVQLPELFHKIGGFPRPASPHPSPALFQSYPQIPHLPLQPLPLPPRPRPSHALLLGLVLPSLHCSLRPRSFPVSLLLLRALGLTSPALLSQEWAP